MSDQSDYYNATLAYAQRISNTQEFLHPRPEGGADPTMSNRQELWMNVFSEVWASCDYNADYTGYAMKLADEALEAFDQRFVRDRPERPPNVLDLDNPPEEMTTTMRLCPDGFIRPEPIE